MRITVYANRYTRTPDEERFGQVDDLAVLGYPVTWSTDKTPGALKVQLEISDGGNLRQDGAHVKVSYGVDDYTLTTYNKMPALYMHTYYGPVVKYPRIMNIYGDDDND